MSKTPIEIFETLMSRESLEGLTVKDQLNMTGVLVDIAGDLGREDGTARALEWCDRIEAGRATEQQKALIEYFRANAWANRQHAKHTDTDAIWQWVQPELQRQVYHLRKAE
jgi:hypothetical protein